MIGWLRARYVVVTVVGHSMEPTFRDGERFVARRRNRELQVGDVVVFVPPVVEPDVAYRVKRVAAIAGDKLFVVGDNPNSQDSRHYGYVDVGAVVAVTRRSNRLGIVSAPAPGTTPVR
jgi:signal peptidase I